MKSLVQIVLLTIFFGFAESKAEECPGFITLRMKSWEGGMLKRGFQEFTSDPIKWYLEMEERSDWYDNDFSSHDGYYYNNGYLYHQYDAGDRMTNDTRRIGTFQYTTNFIRGSRIYTNTEASGFAFSHVKKTDERDTQYIGSPSSYSYSRRFDENWNTRFLSFNHALQTLAWLELDTNCSTFDNPLGITNNCLITTNSSAGTISQGGTEVVTPTQKRRVRDYYYQSTTGTYSNYFSERVTKGTNTTTLKNEYTTQMLREDALARLYAAGEPNWDQGLEVVNFGINEQNFYTNSVAVKNFSYTSLNNPYDDWLALGAAAYQFTYLLPPGKVETIEWIERLRFVDDNGELQIVDTPMSDTFTGTGRTNLSRVYYLMPPGVTGTNEVILPCLVTGRCSAESCTIGNGCTEVHSFSMRFNLGMIGEKSAGVLYAYSDSAGPELAQPHLLDVLALPEVQVRRTNGYIRQIKHSGGLVNIISNTPSQYFIEFYSQAGTDSGGLWATNLSYYVTSWTIMSSNANPNRVQVFKESEVKGEYEWDSGTETWKLRSGGGLRDEYSQEEIQVNGGITNRLQTKWVRQGTNSILYKESKMFQLFADGTERLIEHVIDPDTAKLTNSWLYIDYVAADHPLFGKLAIQTTSDGHWERFSYNETNGRVTKVVQGYLNTHTNAPDNDSLVTIYRYYNYIEAQTNDHWGIAVDSPRYVDTYLLGTLLSKTAYVYTPTGRHEIKGLFEDEDAYSQGEITKYSTILLSTGIVEKVVFPDGTTRITKNATNGTLKEVTVWSGWPGSGSLPVVKGTVSREKYNASGLRTNLIEKAIVADAETVTLKEEKYYYDAEQRLTGITYVDGSFITNVYDCCKLSWSQNREGTVTEYFYDALDRLTATLTDSLLYTNVLDAYGNLLQKKRINVTTNGLNLTTNLLETISFDLAGRPTKTINAMNQTNSISYSFDSNLVLYVTTTYPNNATKVEAFYRDGQPAYISGTAVYGIGFDYGIEDDGNLVMSRFTRETKLDAAVAHTLESITHYFDFSDREYRTRFGTNVYASKVYGVDGKLRSEIDPDGVLKINLYKEGELVASGIDRNGDQQLTTNSIDSIIMFSTGYDSIDGVNVSYSTKTTAPKDNDATEELVSTESTSLDGLRSWRITPIGTSRRVQILSGNGYKIVTNSNPDGSYVVEKYLNGRLTNSVQYGSSNGSNLETGYIYDNHRRITTIRDGRTGNTTYTFNNADQITSVKTPNPGSGQTGLLTTNYFDNMGRKWRTTLPDGTSVTNEFYLTGKLKKTSGSRVYPAEYTYDYSGRQTTLTTWKNYASQSGAAVTSWDFDPIRGWLIAKTYEDEIGTTYTYTSAGKIHQKDSPRGITTTYEYGPSGELTSVDYSDSSEDLELLYDRMGRITRTEKASNTNFYIYAAGGLLVEESFGGSLLGGLSVTNAYDAFGRRSGLGLSNYSATTLRYTYDEFGRNLRITNGSHNVTFDYANKSLLVDQVISRQNSTVRLRSTRSFDNVNRLTVMSNNAAGTTVSWRGYAYDAANQRTKATMEDGSYWNYTYDSLGQVTSGKKRWADDWLVEGQQFEYSYDDIGNHTGEARGGDRWGRNLRYASYNANELNQFTSRTVPSEVDIIGTANTTATVTANTQPAQRKGEYFRATVPVDNTSGATWASITNIAVLNNGTNSDIISTNIGKLLVEPSIQNFSYDADGNLTNDGVWQYIWDAENQLTEVEPVESVRTAYPNEAAKLMFTYDWKGRRIQKRKQVWNSNMQVYLDEYFQRFLYDEWNVVAVVDQNLGLLSSYVWGLDLSGTLHGAGGVGGLVAINTVTNGYHFTYYDGNGNVAGLASSTNGSKTAEFEYDPFGEELRVTGPAAKSMAFRFSTKIKDTETGLVYYGYRFYDSKLNRWVNRDPLAERGGINLYNFVGNAQPNKYDKLGLHSTCSSAPRSCVKLFGSDIWPVGSSWEFMGILPLDWEEHGGASGAGTAKRFACKWQRKYSALFKCCDGKVYATGGFKGAATEVEWTGDDFVIINNPLTLPWSPFPSGGDLFEVAIDTLSQFVPSPLEDNYLNPEDKRKLESMCQSKKPDAETRIQTIKEPIVAKCK